jgi:glycosyltransferase involved in cell wall biosynthesis
VAARRPQVSVVVATRDRPRRLERLLAALRAQDGAPPFEVVVVDDGSRAETVAVLEAVRERGALALEVVRTGDAPRGPGAARNAGWRSARGDAVAFTDDDCEPTPGWLAGLAAAHAAEPRAIVQGRTEPNPADGGRAGVFSRTLRVERLGPRYETCNMLYPRELLEELGGFDEGFGLRPGGEDTDLAWRALEAGRPARFAPDALVHHAVESLGPRGSLRDAARWTETVRVFARHPGARAGLHRRVFWNEWHYLLVRSALALALPPWMRALVLARHALALRDRARWLRAGSAAIPFLLLYDLVELVAVARGAVRHRTLVL